MKAVTLFQSDSCFISGSLIRKGNLRAVIVLQDDRVGVARFLVAS